jgi:hypothetical protein
VEVLKHGSSIGTLFLSLAIKTLQRAAYSIAIAALYYGWEYFSKPPTLKR